MTGYELRQYRLKVERMGLSAFGRLLEVDQSLVSRWENGRRPIPKHIQQLIPLLDPPPRILRHTQLKKYWAGRDRRKPAPPNAPKRRFRSTTRKPAPTAHS